MLKQKLSKIYSKHRGLSLLVAAVLLGASIFGGLAAADQFDAQIKKLEAQNAVKQSQADQFAAQANSYQQAVDRLQIEIDGLQKIIAKAIAQSHKIRAQIAVAQKELDHDKKLLSASILALYQEGQTSTFEVLASSTDLSDFVNKQQYRNAVQDKVKTTFDQITKLKLKLEEQQRRLRGLINDTRQQQAAKNAAQARQNKLLHYSAGQRDKFNQQIANNDSAIASLRAAQMAANHSLLGPGSLSFSSSCGGGYPASASGPYGTWGCNYGKDNTLDNWGMFNRECVSYTAWKVYATYGYMPQGFGNANQWPGDAQARGIATGYTPKAHSVAIWPTASAWGHAMWVESVNGNGTITVSQYNFNFDGYYSLMTISSAGLVFIYFH